MDTYLPADFYRLRDDLPNWRDWRDAPASSVESGTQKNSENSVTQYADTVNTCADPTWRVF
jgi:hypothetical protein